jgi:dihydrolipoamide dehydrogenase
MSDKFDVVVIGSGPGGFRAATRCTQKNASVAIIEKESIGGVCLNWGCIPSKTLLASAHTLLTAKNASNMGIDIGSAIGDWTKIQTRKDDIIAALRKSMTASMKAAGAKMIQGSAIATSPGKIKIQSNCTTTEIQTDKIIIATGSKPIEIPNIPFDGQAVISSKEALNLPGIPKSMVIVGGGVIGCEMACVYAAVGTKVTIVEALSQLLPMEDQWVGRLIEREFKKLDIDVFTDQKVASVDKSAEMPKVVLQSGQTIEAEKILVSVGRKATCDRETIENLNLKLNGSVISVNLKMETNVSGVYAVGDVAGTTYLAHGATTEAEVAAANATGGNKKMSDYSLIPRVIYTFPEVASVGKPQKTCESEGIDISVGTAFFKANGRSVAHNQTTGQIRVVRNKSTNRIMGITIVGEMATELIAAARILIGTSEKISEITFAHPTLSETLEEAVKNALA